MAVVFAGNQCAMPGEQGVGRHDGAELGQGTPAQRVGLRDEADALAVGEPDASGGRAARATPDSPPGGTR
jgi:hypothetical protein